MKNKEVIKKSESIAIILNIVLATFAFAFLVSLSIPGVSANHNSQHDLERNAGIESGGDTSSVMSIAGLIAAGASVREGETALSTASEPTGGSFLGTLFTGELGGTAAADAGKLATLYAENPIAGGFIKGAAWASVALLVVPMVADMLGLGESASRALQFGASTGLFTYQALSGLGAEGGSAIFCRGRTTRIFRTKRCLNWNWSWNCCIHITLQKRKN